jgi:hypothetical protein
MNSQAIKKRAMTILLRSKCGSIEYSTSTREIRSRNLEENGTFFFFVAVYWLPDWLLL